MLHHFTRQAQTGIIPAGAIPLPEPRWETARHLLEAGLLGLFDPGPGTIGAALVIGENRPELRDLLLVLSKAGDAPLIQKVLKVMAGEPEKAAAG
jgi:hypothetical protein